MTEDQINMMVERFLCYELPEDFNPDGGVSFERINPSGMMPFGTNLLNATQARAMVEFMVDAVAPNISPMERLAEPGDLVWINGDIPGVIEEVIWCRGMGWPFYLVEWWHEGGQ